MDVLAGVLELVGAILVVIALGLVDYRLGIITAGLMMLAVGAAFEFEVFNEPEDEQHGTVSADDAIDAEGDA